MHDERTPRPNEVATGTEPYYAPWGTVTASFWASAPTEGPHDPKIPSTVRLRLAAVAGAAAEGRLTQATQLAHQLDEEITAEHGEQHLYTVQAREVRAHIAYLAKDLTTAVGWYLHAARLRAGIQGPGHHETHQTSMRAYSLWRALPPAADRYRIGIELLGAVSDLHGADAPLASRIKERLGQLNQPTLPSAPSVPAAPAAAAPAPPPAAPAGSAVSRSVGPLPGPLPPEITPVADDPALEVLNKKPQDEITVRVLKRQAS